MATHGSQTIKIRVKRNGNGNGAYKACGTCGGTGVVRGNGTQRSRRRK